MCLLYQVDYALLKNSISCASSMQAGLINKISDNGTILEDSSIEPTVKMCSDYCYVVWKESVNESRVIIAQDCWDEPGEQCDQQKCVANKKPSKALNNTKFCCCSTNMCNENFTTHYLPEEDVVPPTVEVLAKTNFNIILWLGLSVCICLVFLIVLLFCVYEKWKLPLKLEDVESAEPLPPPTDYSLDKLKLLNVIGQGRYGSVWRGIIDDQEIAVKVFSSHHRNYFVNEYDVYKVAGENLSLLRCYGGGEYITSPGGPPDYLLLLSLEQECLQDYLKKCTLDLATLSKMSLGIAKGLAHLHSDLGKPCIAHRDVNTRNILVKSDLSCCICDLGLAVIPRGNENRSLTEAGTLRYMAPEVLEGAVNLRDCESALKQIDVYALGLVLWEMGVRCTELLNKDPDPYAPPFYKEAGDNPSLEQMQTLVSRRKARPLWPMAWKDTAAAKLLRETSEDCWDQDAEARLTSLCVVERLLELPSLKGRVLHPHHPPASPTPLINNNHLHDRQLEVSVGTVETLLSPSDEYCKNSNHLVACAIPLQPYQGRNPCLERNLNSESSDSILIDKSSKQYGTSDSDNLIVNEIMAFQYNHRAAPIPYLQNVVHSTPKITNQPVVNTKSSFKWYNFKRIFSGPKSGVQKQTQVKLNSKLINGYGRNSVTTSLLGSSEVKRPSTLPLSVVKSKETIYKPSGISQITKTKNSISRQQSFEQFNEVFCSTSDLSRLKNPSLRVKTPGDVPPSVRRTRGKAAKESRFSLYDDRIMGQWNSAPNLEPSPLRAAQIENMQDRDSVSSF